MRRYVPLSLAAVLALVLAPAPPGAAAPRPAHVTVIQAVPGASVEVRIDGRSLASNVEVGDVLGPFDLRPGTHDISFTAVDLEVDASLRIGSGAASDVVLHLPADVGGEPVVHSYRAPTGSISPGTARVMLAHTATVAPADVEVNGETVFTNIANGEFADADVPEGTIQVALVPSGSPADPILGPLDVTLEGSTLSMIYAYGNPRDGSMNVISHTTGLAPDGSVRPSVIDTGSAGLVEDPVDTFGIEGPGVTAWAAAGVGALVAGLLLLMAVQRRHRGRRAALPVR